ncbi:MAG TPA: O-antigen ligase family protein, partial [Anaerolineae bacterium]|nr:O-antigen ligase family protein [Anaerolineae bacterium]
PFRVNPWWPSFVLALHALLLVAIGASAVTLRLQARSAARGVTFGPPTAVQPAISDRVGVNLSLEQYGDDALASILADLQARDIRWLRQSFSWAEIEPRKGQFDWSTTDRILQAVSDHQLQIIATLDTSPDWARADEDADNRFAPPHERSDFGSFAAAFAARYRDLVDHYQIWDEPNIAPHWGGRPVEPAGYLGLLREGYVQVRAADPTAWVIMAGLAPTIEGGGANLSDLAYLEQLYQLGAAEYFDIAAAKPYGFDIAPGAAVPSPAELNFSRVALLREVMERHGDRHTPLWAVEFGWNALPSDWEGEPSIWGQVDESQQEAYLQAAVVHARRDWPWLGLMIWADFQPAVPADNARWGFALVDQDGEPRPALAPLTAMASSAAALPPGVYAPNHPALIFTGDWRLTPDGADAGRTGDAVSFEFDGTRLDLEVQRGPFWAYFTVSVDGQPANGLPRDERGNANLILYDPLAARERVTLARGLDEGVHRASIVAHGGWGQWALRRIIVSREPPAPSPWLWGGLVVMVLLTIGNGVRLSLRLSTQESLRWTFASLHRLTESVRLFDDRWLMAALIAGVALFTLSPWMIVGLAGLGLIALVLLVRLDLVLPLIAFAIPFFLRSKSIFGRQFSHIEILTLLGTAVLISQAILRICRSAWHRYHAAALAEPDPASAALPGLSRLLHALSWLDWAVVAFVAASALSLLAARNTGVALREFRVLIVEPSLFYLLVSRALRPDGRPLSLWPLADGLVLGAMVVSLIGIWQLITGQGRVDVEGVWRVRALYGSPNNLGLYLGRIIPLVGAVAVYGRTRWRRWAYGLLLLPIGLACVATYSKGALLLGLPAAILFLGLAGSRLRIHRRRWQPAILALVLLAMAAVALIPLFSTERFAGLLDFREGTSFIRLQLWRGALNMIRDHPWLGVGLDNFLYEYRTRYVLPVAWEELGLSHPHNLLLDLWTRIGLPGVMAGLWLLVAGFGAGWRSVMQAKHPDQRALALGLLGGLVATVAHGLIDNSIFLVDLAFVLMLSLGIFRRKGEDSVRS